MKLQIELTEEQLQMIVVALENSFRPLMNNQMDFLAEYLADCSTNYRNEDGSINNKVFDIYLTKREDIEYVLESVQKIMYGRNLYSDLPKEAHRLSDMWSVIRHFQYGREEHDDWYDVRSHNPIQLSDWPLIKIEEVTE